MAEDPLFCENIGLNTTDNLSCCFASDQSSPTCRSNLNPNANTFTVGCRTNDCLKDCSDPKVIFRSDLADYAISGNGFGPIRRFSTCANVPAMAGYLSQKALEQDILSSIGKNISSSASNDDLKSVTSAVTQCLTSTCQNARHPTVCETSCSAVNLLTNYTTPNIDGVNDCLYNLCRGGWNSLPYADADIIGIGVFASYLMQCMLVVIVWVGLCAFVFHYKYLRPTPTPEYPPPQSEDQSPEPLNETEGTETKTPTRSSGLKMMMSTKAVKDVMETHQPNYGEFFVQFHKAQCYFSATIQIASISYGIFGADMLKVFTLTPLATNGVLPVVFAFFILFHSGKSTVDVTLPTLVCWLLSSLIYWILYSSVVPFNHDISSDLRRYLADTQFIYKLSANDECGGYSALAACPRNFHPGKDDLVGASHRLRVLTPIIWTFSTVCLLTILADKLIIWLRPRSYEMVQGHDVQRSDVGSVEAGMRKSESPVRRLRTDVYHSFIRASITYWVVLVCFLAGIGMQLSLLSIGTSLKMMDRMHWSFGQVVAVTIWVPPIFGYLYSEFEARFGEKFNFGDPERIKDWKIKKATDH